MLYLTYQHQFMSFEILVICLLKIFSVLLQLWGKNWAIWHERPSRVSLFLSLPLHLSSDTLQTFTHCQTEVLTSPGLWLSLWLLRFQYIFLSSQNSLPLTYLSLRIQLDHDNSSLSLGCLQRCAHIVSYTKTHTFKMHLSTSIVIIWGP